VKYRPAKNQKGIALLIALFTVVLITYLVMEISYDTNVEYMVNANSVNRLKAYYAAKSGLQLSLFRIKLYNRVQKQLGKQMGSQVKLLDMIWSFPFSWPLMIPTEASSVDKELVNDTIEKSLMDASYSTSISDEGSKIDINDLDSPSKKLQEITRKQILNMFESRMRDDQEFANKHSGFRPEELIGNIKDWIDRDTAGTVRGSESELYGDLNRDGVQLPPNRAFRSVEELRLVAGMEEDFFKMLKDRVTVFGMKAINPNHASKEVLMSIDNSITEEVAQEIIKRRQDEDLGGPFKDGTDNCKSDFWGFVNSRGGRVANEIQDAIPLMCSKVSTFRIKSVGEFGGVMREIEAIVFDPKLTAEVVAEYIKKEKEKENPPPSGGSQPTNPAGANSGQQQQSPPPAGPPRIVYYNEK
jgi:general secretion pathway protein K